MIKIAYLPNRFERQGVVEQSCLFLRTKTIQDYITELEGIPAIDLEHYDVIVLGRCAKSLEEHVNYKDEIIITPKIADPITAFFTWAVSTLWAAVVAHPFIAAATLASLGYSVYSAFQQPSMPSFGTISGGGGLDEGSPTYGWDGVQTNRQVNTAVPAIFGEHIHGGTVINEYIYTDGDKNFLNMLIAIGEGEIESISSIKINGNPLANFNGASYDIRYGTNSQTVIPNFEDLHNTIAVNVQLMKNAAYVYTTINNDIEAFELKLQLPVGLYQQDSGTGEILSWQVIYKVEYKLTTSGTWIDAGTSTISDRSRSVLRRTFRKEGLTAGKYDIRITKLSDDSTLSPNKTGDFYLQSVDEIKTDDLQYPNTALLALRLLATEQISGASPNVSYVVKGRKVSVPRVMNGGNEVNWEDYYWDPATSQFKLFSDGTVLSWDGTTYVNKWGANPIWCLKDMITNNRYGLGDFISTSIIDSALSLANAKHCEERVPDGNGGYEKRYRLDVAIDSPTAALDLINQLSATFNAFAFYSAGGVKLSIDKAASPVQMFGMSNIIKSSFEQSWKSMRDRPNVIEVQFMDKDKEYEQETVEIIDEAALTAGEPLRTYRMRVFTTRMSYALRLGRYALKVARNIDETIAYKASIDAIACQVGDRIDFSHDVPQWGFSGNVKSGSTTTSILLDQSVVIEASKTYKLRIRFADDAIEEKTVSNSPGTYSTLTVSSAFSQAPAAYDKYAFGETNKVVKPFRIIAMERDDADRATIKAVEYNEAVYDDTAVVIPNNNYSALSREIPNVTNLSAIEKNVILNDGSIGSIIEVYFLKPPQASYILNRYARAKVYISDDSGVSWQLAGTTSEEFLSIGENIKAGNTYKIAVVSVSSLDEENAIATSPQATITILGKLLPPSNVANFDVSQQGDQLHFSWSPVTDKDLARYIIKRGSEWATGDIIAEKIDVTEFDFPIGTIGQETYMIKAIDTSGNESVSTTSDTVTVTPPPEMNFALEIDPWAGAREYKLSGAAREKMNLFDKSYARDVFSLATATKWEDIEASTEGWDKKETDGDLNENKLFEASGSYEEVTPWDLQTIFEFKIIVSAQYKNVTGGTLTVQVSTSEDGITYSAFANINASTNYRARYVKFKYILATSDTNHNIYWYSATIFINAATVKTDYGRDLLVGASGTAVNFRSDFTAAPRITGLAIKNNIIGIVYAENVTATGMTIHVVNTSGVGIGTGEVDWEVRGS